MTIIDAINSKATAKSIKAMIDKVVPQERGTLASFEGVFKYATYEGEISIGTYGKVVITAINPNSGYVVGFGNMAVDPSIVEQVYSTLIVSNDPDDSNNIFLKIFMENEAVLLATKTKDQFKAFTVIE